MCGRLDVDRILEELTSEQIHEWATYFRIEPDAELKADARHGTLAYLIAKTMGGAKSVKPSDFVPEWKPKFEADKPQTMQEMINVAKKMTLMMGGTVN